MANRLAKRAALTIAGFIAWFGVLFAIQTAAVPFDSFWKYHCRLFYIGPEACAEMYPYHLYSGVHYYLQIVFLAALFSPIVAAAIWAYFRLIGIRAQG